MLLFFLFIDLCLRCLGNELLVAEHVSGSLQFTFKTCFFLLQTLNFSRQIHQIRKRNVNRCIRNGYCYGIISDAGLILLADGFRSIGKAFKEQPAGLKDLQQLLLLTDHVYLGLTGRSNVHLRTYITDSADSFLNGLNLFFILCKIPCLLIYRPGRDHDGFLFILHGAEDFLCNKRHVRVQEL